MCAVLPWTNEAFAGLSVQMMHIPGVPMGNCELSVPVSEACAADGMLTLSSSACGGDDALRMSESAADRSLDEACLDAVRASRAARRALARSK